MISRQWAITGSGSAPALAPGVLEGIEEPGHLDELDRAVEVAGEPELLEIGNVTQIPEDRAHERIVLGTELLVGQWRREEERPVAGLEELPGYDPRIEPAGDGNRSHGLSRPHPTGASKKGTQSYDMADFAAPRASEPASLETLL